MANKFLFGDREISKDHQPFIIAEIGINHNGSLEEAFKLVDAAHEAGVEVIKHQTHTIHDEMSVAAKNTIPGNTDKSIYAIMEECALSEEEEFKLMQYVKSKNIQFFSSAFSKSAIDRLSKFDVPAFKVGSGECNNLPLLAYMAKFKKPVILSTGMNDLETVKKAVKVFSDKNVPVALLHTTNLYPTPESLVRLGAMTELEQAFPDCPVGLSDHTLSNLACLGAIALGASILERHFTDTMQRIGPDISCSMDIQSCKELIESSKRMFVMRGGGKTIIEEEQVTRDFAFSSVVATTDINPGTTLSEDNIWVKRPGKNGIPAEKFDQLLGRIAKKKILSDTQVSFDDLEP